MTGGARARARQVIKAEVSAIAIRLCVRDGYDNTTIDDICAAAELSRSTFFRYFASKDDALLGDVEQVGAELLSALQQRPNDEPIWVALQHALDALIANYASDPERARHLVTLMQASPSLAAAHLGKHARWVPLLVPEIARRIGSDLAGPADPRPTALASAALACSDAALGAWKSAPPDRSLKEVLGQAMSAAIWMHSS